MVLTFVEALWGVSIMGTRESWWRLLGYIGVAYMCVDQGCAWCMWESCHVGGEGGGSSEVAANVCIML